MAASSPHSTHPGSLQRRCGRAQPTCGPVRKSPRRHVYWSSRARPTSWGAPHRARKRWVRGPCGDEYPLVALAHLPQNPKRPGPLPVEILVIPSVNGSWGALRWRGPEEGGAQGAYTAGWGREGLAVRRECATLSRVLC
jgi:hypothetical protein